MNPLQAKGNLNHLGKIGKNDRINPLSFFIFLDFEQHLHNGKFPEYDSVLCLGITYGLLH